MEAPDDFDLNKEKREIIDLLENSDRNIFLTGKAGTGKSHFLKHFRATTKKNVVVLAFTGVAAINVQGQTIHSFFRFHPQTTLDSIRRLSDDRENIYKKINTIIIDEISMVRADLLDLIDKFMRLNGNSPGLPFGGVQIFAIGDLFQLPPIVTSEEEMFFKINYESPYFFDSRVFAEANFVKKELTKMYRQDSKKQNAFIKALDNIRTCTFDKKDLDLINSRFVPNYKKPDKEFVLSLVPTNSTADSINRVEMDKLKDKPVTYEGTISGEFREKDLPTDKNLTLKVGSQVMLLNNDPLGRWVNGDIVKIIKTDKESVRVLFDDNTFEDITTNTRDSIRFVFDKESGKIQPEVAGSFTQLPIKLSWAVTIHKGQGKTFDKVHIDFGRGTFVHGQAYVALSRCRTLEGMTLTTPVQGRYIFIDERVKQFMDLN
ncbi:MAG: hypothetical protein A2507_02645 [Candidatus Magasanikbacteria bacterium RIFOXYD12_FULL_33_17]|nr:MAG: hypothetical protein A2507_02645 [Candidatus Magasanikbacteria bacterium RIFOXYD12_FULL_33_17]